MENEKSLTLAYRLSGIFIALIFAIPTVFFFWLVINIEIASLQLFINSRAFWVTSMLAIVIGFLAPDLLINILGRIWTFLLRLAKWY